MLEGQFLVIKSEEMKDCCMQVVNLNLIGLGAMTNLVCFSEGRSALYSSTRKPVATGMGIMVSPRLIAFLSNREAPKLTTPYDEGFVKKAAIFKILQEFGDGLIGLAGKS